MAETTGELRRDLDEQRDDIARTVDEIQNRVSPGRVWTRQSHRMRHRFTDWKDRIMGNDQPYYSSGNRSGSSYGTEGLAAVSGERLSDAKETVAGAPEALRRQTQGNPLAAGLIAFGAGLPGVKPDPRDTTGQKLAEGVQPLVSDVVGEARQAASAVAQELKEPAEQAVQDVKDVAQQAASKCATPPRRAWTRSAGNRQPIATPGRRSGQVQTAPKIAGRSPGTTAASNPEASLISGLAPTSPDEGDPRVARRRTRPASTPWGTRRRLLEEEPPRKRSPLTRSVGRCRRSGGGHEGIGSCSASTASIPSSRPMRRAVASASR